MKILVFGDVVGRMGREALKMTLPRLKEQHRPDLTIANVENAAHGLGVTTEMVRGFLEMGVDFMTSGNHIWKRQDAWDIFADPQLRDKLIRPANYPPELPGAGAKMLTVGTKNVLVLNLMGRVMMKVEPDSPFQVFDRLWDEFASQRPDIVLVDFHAEATSEKQAMGWHVDGRATALWGTHTHVPTADGRLLPQGTGYVTDIGFCGFRNGILGVSPEPVMQHMRLALPLKLDPPDKGEAEVWGILIDIGADNRTKSLSTIHEIVEIG